MTDHPRFRMADGGPDKCYRQHHGAALVEWVFRAADWWLKHRDAITSLRFGSVWEKHHDAPQR